MSQLKKGQKLPQENIDQVISLFLHNLPRTDIAQQTGLSRTTVQKYIDQYLEQTQSSDGTKHQKLLILHQLQELYDGVIVQAKTGDYKAVKSAVSIIDRKAKIFGLYAPEQVINNYNNNQNYNENHTAIHADIASMTDRELAEYNKTLSYQLDNFGQVGLDIDT